MKWKNFGVTPEERRKMKRLWIVYAAVMAVDFILALVFRPGESSLLLFLFMNVLFTLDVFSDFTEDLVQLGPKMARWWLIADILGMFLATVVFVACEVLILI